MRIVTLLAMLSVWVLAAVAWPELPERIPVHFDIGGRADRWVAKSAVWWFLLPALATAVGLLLALALPRWMVAMARSNSPWLGVPDKRRFAALPVEARERAIRTPLPWLHALATCVQVLIGWTVHGSARVATGAWQTLPSVPSFVLVGTLLACAGGLTVAGVRAVRREIMRTHAG